MTSDMVRKRTSVDSGDGKVDDGDWMGPGTLNSCRNLASWRIRRTIFAHCE